jgi:DNA invertase Pin-like site-specific DNA recombinase
MRIEIYGRVSTKDQSCELQVHNLRAYCAARGFDLVREYVDVGQSGGKDSRPELNKLMDDARKRLFDAIVVWRFNRFARLTKHLLLALEEFRSLGIQFISHQENIYTSSALGQALFTIVSAVAQLERDLIGLA